MMGGMGSGARRSTQIGNVEGAIALDIRALRRLGFVKAGECICERVCWAIDGLGCASAHLRVDLSDVHREGGMTVTAIMMGRTLAQRIAIEAIPTSLGGWRCYFVCPVAGVRCEVIYWANGRFACRGAQGLTYASQNMTDLTRLMRKASKLRLHLDGGGDRGRPRGRHRIELVKRLREADVDAKALYYERLAAMYNRSGTRRIPTRR